MTVNWRPLLNGAQANVLVLALLPMLGSSHAGAQAPPQTTAPNLGGTSWQLVKFQGGDERTLTPDDKTKYTLQFNADGRVAARIDCNRGTATWKASGSQLQLGPLALTRAACLSPVLHDRIVKDWEYVRSYIVKDGHLFLSLMADAGIYEFEPTVAAKQGASAGTGAATQPPARGGTSPQGAAASNIEGTVWRLTRLRGQPDQAVASLSRPATLQFDAGRIQAFGGCNRLVGSYTINGDLVTIGQLAGTMMACAQPVMAVETAFNKALTGTLRIRLAANGLTLTAESESDPTLVFVAEPVK
jgi:heat shock protein HslJ